MDDFDIHCRGVVPSLPPRDNAWTRNMVAVPPNLPSTLDALKHAVTVDRVGEVLRSVARHLVNAD